MLQSSRIYHFQDFKVARVPKVAKLKTLSSEGYKGCMDWKGYKISHFIIFRI